MRFQRHTIACFVGVKVDAVELPDGKIDGLEIPEGTQAVEVVSSLVIVDDDGTVVAENPSEPKMHRYIFGKGAIIREGCPPLVTLLDGEQIALGENETYLEFRPTS
jgi:hypothetical protein